ncbi:hypothetical protein Ddye_011840 [Dipteronia dyeriana]|uniref:Uncharacterized protein n=1 Tax=Dipteronia dyeriana TaxID=168575 RepID=A0AAE0CHP4_9ROSI|nr:hypothetical protein Ddye_011840 [Dipteronia dyeriana]
MMMATNVVCFASDGDVDLNKLASGDCSDERRQLLAISLGHLWLSFGIAVINFYKNNFNGRLADLPINRRFGGLVGGERLILPILVISLL